LVLGDIIPRRLVAGIRPGIETGYVVDGKGAALSA
jgi:hypothetical protein